MRRLLLVSEGAAEQESLATVTQDIWMNGTGAIAFVLMVIMAAVQPHATKANNPAAALPPGEVGIRLTWSQDLKADIDLWVKGPTGNPIGFTNKEAPLYDLKHDDQGEDLGDDVPAFAKAHEEWTYSNGLIVGTTCVNVVLYDAKTAAVPIAVNVQVYVSKGAPKPGEDPKGDGKPILVSSPDLKLVQAHQELNVFCFTLDTAGNLLPGDKGVYSSQAIRMYNR